ncbi:HEPN domain-containing protein, partial [bacterium]|nr:HEPN domain-containing protein [bacterium]
KLLKAYYVKNIDNNPPYIHNLLRLAEKANIQLSEAQKDILVTVNAFNIQARYDDYKSAFYRTCSKEYTEKWTNEIKGFRTWIKALLSRS